MQRGYIRANIYKRCEEARSVSRGRILQEGEEQVQRSQLRACLEQLRTCKEAHMAGAEGVGRRESEGGEAGESGRWKRHSRPLILWDSVRTLSSTQREVAPVVLSRA